VDLAGRVHRTLHDQLVARALFVVGIEFDQRQGDQVAPGSVLELRRHPPGLRPGAVDDRFAGQRNKSAQEKGPGRAGAFAIRC